MNYGKTVCPRIVWEGRLGGVYYEIVGIKDLGTISSKYFLFTIYMLDNFIYTET